jgi:hypothetical protein
MTVMVQVLNTFMRVDIAIIGLGLIFVALQLISPEWFHWLYARRTYCKGCKRRIQDQELEKQEDIDRYKLRAD